LIGGEQKFVRLAFTQEANDLQNAYMATLFGNFGAKNLSNGGELLRNIYRNPNSPRVDKLLFLNIYNVYNLYILTLNP
jgi:hypothetical protein